MRREEWLEETYRMLVSLLQDQRHKAGLRPLPLSWFAKRVRPLLEEAWRHEGEVRVAELEAWEAAQAPLEDVIHRLGLSRETVLQAVDYWHEKGRLSKKETQVIKALLLKEEPPPLDPQWFAWTVQRFLDQLFRSFSGRKGRRIHRILGSGPYGREKA